MSQRVLPGFFQVAVADPPWHFEDSLPGPARGASKHYRTLSLDDIKRFPLPPIGENAWLFLWRVGAMVPEAYEVVKAWGFEVKSEIVWVKTVKGTSGPAPLRIGMGRTVRNSHETAIVAKRGNPKRLSASIPSVIFAPPTQHSAKPALFYDKVEEFAEGPYVDIFARRYRYNWTCIGDELAEEEQTP